MPFLLLLLLTLTYLQGSYPKPLFGGCEIASVAVTWGGTVVLIVLAALIARLGVWQLHQAPVQRNRILRRVGRLRRWHFWAMLAFYLLALYVLGWGWLWAPAPTGAGAHAATPFTPANMLPGLQILLLSPFLCALVISWYCYYDIEYAAHRIAAGEQDEPFLTRSSYVALQARHNLLLMIPPLVPLIMQQALLYFYPQVDKAVTEIFAAVLLVATFVSIPLVLRLVLGLRPLPEGPLRTRLMQTAQRLKFRFNDILVWDSRRTMVNAMVTGPLPFLRYVVLTDRLIESLGEGEIEAVFGHEVGHVKHHHMLFYLGFLLGSMVVLSGLWSLASSWLDASATGFAGAIELPWMSGTALDLTTWTELVETLATLLLLTLVSIYVFVVFGFISRRCERQADIFGCRTVSCDVFINALEQVAYLNGIDRERPGWLSSWQHSTIARRVAFIRRMMSDPNIEPRFQRNFWLLKWSVVVGLAAALFALRDHIWIQDDRPDRASPTQQAISAVQPR